MKKEQKNRYSPDELGEFEQIINGKLEKARTELNYIQESLSKSNDSGTDNTASTIKILEDGADTAERENLSQLAARQQKFIFNLENA